MKKGDHLCNLGGLTRLLQLRVPEDEIQGENDENKKNEKIGEYMREYISFMRKLMPAVVGEKNWKANVWIDREVRKDFNKYITPTEEAWAIINVQNGWVRYMYDKDDGKERNLNYLTEDQIRACEKHDEEQKTRTNKKKFPNMWTSATSVSGWDITGRIRFNKLVAQIKQDRERWGERFQDELDVVISNDINARKPKKKKPEEPAENEDFAECTWEEENEFFSQLPEVPLTLRELLVKEEEHKKKLLEQANGVTAT